MWETMARAVIRFWVLVLTLAGSLTCATGSWATQFTSTVPGTSFTLPSEYPQAGGVAFVLLGRNGNLYYQFSNPTGAFVGFQYSGSPRRFRGNPFTINDPIELDCGFSECRDYFGGGIEQVFIRFSAYDGDTQPGGFDENDIDLYLNGYNVGSWSGLRTEITNRSGTRSFGFSTGFGNNTFNTGWFSSTNPALLEDILATGQTTTQVLDYDPNDNYWDFRRGRTLTNNNIVTVAPGYTLEKTANKTDFLVLGETIDYTYVVTNIGSVPIRSLTVEDDVIGTVSCDKAVIFDTDPGGVPDFATCRASYQVTQEDVDRGFVTNNARAEGRPDFGELGALTDTVRVDGPPEAPNLFVEKSSTLTNFADGGSVVPYDFVIRNDGNVTLSDVTVSDPLLPGLICDPPDLAPGDAYSCSGVYTVQQADVDDYIANAANTLDNTVTVRARTAQGTQVAGTDNVSLPGPLAAPGVNLIKTATTQDYDAVGDTLNYQIRIENTGNVTFPVPTVSDALTGGATCQSGSITPGAFVICSASYQVVQADIDNGFVENTASVSFNAAGVPLSDSDTANVPAVRSTGLMLQKRLAPASAVTFDAVNDELTYEYVLTNTGTVTLLTPEVTDNKVTVTCAAPQIAPQGSVVCTSAPYVVTQLDLNAGEVSNEATATATQAGPTPVAVTSNTDDLTVPATQEPALTLTKTAPVVSPAVFQPGEVIQYSFAVQNTGNIDLTLATTGETQITITDDKIGTFSCQALPLAVGATASCVASYEITLADFQLGTIVNVATANIGNDIVSPQQTATVSPNVIPAISLEKSATTASVAQLSDVITYEFVVENTGNSILVLPGNQISITDDRLTAPADCTAQPASFAPGASFSCTGTRSGITQAELDAGAVDNSAIAQFDFTRNGSTVSVASNESTATVPVVPNPSMVFTKSGPATFPAVGQPATFQFTVENDGNVTLAEVVVTDPLLPGLTCRLTNIAPGATQSCSGDYLVKQSDVDAEVINNTAAASATPTQGSPFVELDSETVPIDPAVPSKSADFDKVASRTSFTRAGQVITYTLAVENTGTQTLTNVTVTDDLDPSFGCIIPSIAPMTTDSTCGFTHVVTQDDIDAGQVVNIGRVSSADIAEITDTETVNGPARTAGFDFEKQVSGDFTAPGQTLTYTFRVENTGNVTLSNVTITDPFFGAPVSCTIARLAPGAADTTCTATYVTDQTDIDAGALTNTATASVDVPPGVTAPADQQSSVTSRGPAENASVTIDKQSTDGAFANATDSEDFTFVVTNSGNVTLTNLAISDAQLGFSCPLAPLLPGQSTSVCADTTPLQATKTFSQQDVDAASYSNTAVVTGESAGRGTAVRDEDIETVVGPAQTPSITIAKSTGFVGRFDTVGQAVPYTYLIRNTGNITLTGSITVADDKIPTVTCDAPPAAGIAPNGTLQCTGVYRVTQDDLDIGRVTNKATASATQPVAPQNPGDPPFVQLVSNEASVTVDATQTPALRIEKRVKQGASTSYSAPGDVITFEYVVTNTGNVTTTDPITVSDNQIAGSLTCTSAPLAPGSSVTCEQDWTADLDDLDAGSVTNIATASTLFDGVAVPSAPKSVTVNAVQTPQLSIEKTFISTNNPGFFNAGDALTYEIVVTNTGNVTIDGPIVLDDNLSVPSCPVLPGNELAPGQTYTCPSSHLVTNDDISLGASTNVVSATGTFGGTSVQSPSDDAIYPVDASPALSLTKTARGTNVPYDAVGQNITYDYTVENTGNVGLTGEIKIVDDVIGTFVCKPGGGGALGSGDDFTCSATHQIDQSDLDRGFVTNNATAQTLFPPGSLSPTQVVSPNAAETVSARGTPELTMTKDVISGQVSASAGDTLTYRIVAENTGNQTLSGVTISDPMIPVTSCTLGLGGAAAPINVILAPGETLVCEGDYLVTQADVDAQTLENTANATGTDPQGATVSAAVSDVHPIDAPNVDMLVTKEVAPGPLGVGQDFANVGQEITFVVSVQNTGNISLNDLIVTDERPVTPTSCTIATLAPGTTDQSCAFTYVITQADLDESHGAPGSEFAGFTNTANVTATPDNPNLAAITRSDDVFVKGPPQEPSFGLVKASTTTAFSTLNQRIEYTYTISNTGNVTLFEAPEIEDDKIPGRFVCVGMPSAGLPPGEFYACTNDYFVTQSDLDNGSVTNTARATSSEVDDPAVAELTIDAVRAPSVTLTKTADPGANAGVNDTVTYTYVATNTGNVTLNNLTLDDQHTSAAGVASLPIVSDRLTNDAGTQNDSVDAAGPGIWSSLASGDTISFEATYTVTQADIDGLTDITNTATLTAQDPNGDTVTATSAATVPLEIANPELTAIKVIGASVLSNPPAPGDRVNFDIRVTNSGNQTLGGVTVTDTLKRADGTAVAIAAPVLTGGDTGAPGDMSPGEVWALTASHILTQDDIDAGGITNQVQAAGVDPNGGPVTDLSDDDTPANGGSDPARLLIPAAPGIEGEKTVLVSASDVGETVTFDIVISNTGNVTLTDVAVASDTLTRLDGTPIALTSAPVFGGATQNSPAGRLLPNERATYRATYTLTQADIDAGGIANSATVSGQPPVGSPITDVTDDGDDADGNAANDRTEVLIAAQRSIALTKDLGSTAPTSFADPGIAVPYDFTVKNTSNVTLFGAVTIADPLITDAGGQITCPPLPPAGLAPGAVVTCTGTYVTTQTDVDTGQIENRATATLSGVTAPAAEAVIPAIKTPELTVEKIAPNLPAADFVVGAEITYRFVITNTGNATITQAIAIDDTLIPAGDITCPVFPANGLLPGQTYECSGVYTVTSTDVNLGSVTNLASASDGETTSLIDSATIPNAGVPSLDIEKSADVATFDAVDDVITYTFTVTNSGSRAFVNDVVVTDTLIDTPIVCFTATAGDIDFISGETAVCTAEYRVTQEDLDRGFVLNEAYASTVFGIDNAQVFSDPSKVQVDGTVTPSLTIQKRASQLPVTAVGQVLTYGVTITNSGNQTISNVVATDPMLDGFTCESSSLAPGDALDCSGTYAVKQSDIDAGRLSNTAKVAGVSPQGAAVTDEVTLDIATPAAMPAVSLVKAATPTPFGPVGSTLTYQFTVENTGNVTLSGLEITDVLDAGYSCTIATLAPTNQDTTCILEVDVTQEMVDAGFVDNQANVTGADPFGTGVSDSAALRTQGPARDGALVATKVVLPAPGTVGAVVPYVLTVENTGNVTLSNVVITDVMSDGNSASADLDAPFALDPASDLNGDLLLSVGEVWTYRAAVTLTQIIINSGSISNQVTVNASDPAGNPVSDVSDDGDNNDGDTTSDPTLFDIPAGPQLTLVKTVKTPGAVVGDEVVFLITATNTGNVSLTGVSVTDTLTRINGDPLVATIDPIAVPEPLGSGADATWEVRHILTQDDVDAGGLSNTATASAVAPDGRRVVDVSADDDPTDGNVTDDPTVVQIVPRPAFEVVKTSVAEGAKAGELVTYEITLKNTGTVTLSNIGLTDALTDLDGANPRSPNVSFVGNNGAPASPEGSLAPGEVATYRSEVVLQQTDIEIGGLINTITASAQTPLGGSITDVSDDDGTGIDDPTVVTIAPSPSLSIEKTTVSVSYLFPTVEQTTFSITVTNTGNLIQTGIDIIDDLQAFAAPAILMSQTYPLEIDATGFADATVNPAYDGVTDTALLSGNPTLAPGETGTVTLSVAYSTLTGPAGENAASVNSAQIVASARGFAPVIVADADGDGVPDSVERGTGDRDGDGIPNEADYDPTGYFYCEDTGAILSGGQISVSGNGFTQTGVGSSGPIFVVRDGSQGDFQFHVSAPGSYRLGLTYPPSAVPSTARQSLGTLDVTSLLPGAAASIGSNENGSSGGLADFSAGANPFYTVFDIEAGDPFVLNNNIPLTQCADASDVLATKTADRDSAVFGETVNYTLSFRNDSSITYTAAQIVDRLPPGLVYTPNSARVDGAAAEPVITGGSLTWGVDLAPAQTINVTFAARVRRTGEFGVMTNRAWVDDALGQRVSNVARADVRIDPEPVFDCSDVIGKVFDDRNSNGYQDGPGTDRGITRQTYLPNKFGALPSDAPVGEPGLPNVRLATPDGLLITTDEHGRFSVPCAALPRSAGSNFQLKLDTRTLPTGYRVTTENPRNIRLTPGKIAKLNFGASLSQVVRIDLDQGAFAAGQATPGAPLMSAVDSLVTQIATTPSVLRLTYVLSAGEPPETGRARLSALETLIRDQWRGTGRYKLIIERTVMRGVK